MHTRWRGLSLAASAVALICASSGAAATGADPLASAAGIYKLGAVEGSGSVGVPYQGADGTRGVLTAKHGVTGIGPTEWQISAADGTSTTGQVIGVGSIDVALIRSTAQWATPPDVRLADDFAARFSATARSTADAPPGTRVCRTGWSPLSTSTGPGGGSPNYGSPPDVPGEGMHVVCGRVLSSSDGQIMVGQSDRPDGAIAARGDSGGALWRVTNDGGFLFLGIMTGIVNTGCGPIPGTTLLACDRLIVLPAWKIDADTSLSAAPMMAPYAVPFLTIDPSTYRPTPAAPVTLRGSLRTPANEPIAGQTVTLLTGSPLSPTGQATTDAQGNVSFTTAPITGARDFAFSWAGNSASPPIASRIISVGSTRVDRISAPASVPAGQPLVVTARASDATGRPVVGRPMELRSYDATGAHTVLATATTDADGEARLDSGPLTGPLTYALRIAGDDPATNGNPVGAAASSIITVPIT